MDFETYFQKIYQDRWENLFKALCQEPKRYWVKLKNFEISNDQEKASAPEFYKLDLASLEPVRALKVKPGMHVLDLCAAPGGKGLFLYHALQGLGSITLNEYSSPRRRRLKEVLNQYQLENESRIEVTGIDGLFFGMKRKALYDCVLVDAPCSSERHLIEQNETALWKENRSKYIARKQYSLLCSAALTLKPGGVMVYSTCSISPYENDEVMRRFFDKKSELGFEPFLADSTGIEGSEKTEFGIQIFPDRTKAGPIYFACTRAAHKANI